MLPPGTVYEQPVISLDISATIAAAAAKLGDRPIDGTNLLPYASGECRRSTLTNSIRFGQQWAIRDRGPTNC